jgi:hypothetical protein
MDIETEEGSWNIWGLSILFADIESIYKLSGQVSAKENLYMSVPAQAKAK